MDSLAILLKEQDKITREACAEAIVGVESKYLEWNQFAEYNCDKEEECIRKFAAKIAIHNAKAT